MNSARHLEVPLPADLVELSAVLPDTPQWIYARSLLLSGAAVVHLGAAGNAALVADSTTAVLIGHPDYDLLRELSACELPGRSLLVEPDAAETACAALPGWIARPFVVHGLPYPLTFDAAPAPGVLVSAPLDQTLLHGLPDDVRAEAVDAPAAAIRFVDQVPVAICFVSDQTETLWDVGIDTVEPARRRGHAIAVFRTLAARLAAEGRQPVWAAYEDYPPSLALAARLDFRPVSHVIELTPPEV